MKRVIRAIREVKTALLQIKLLESLLDGLICFLAFYLLLLLIQANPFYSIIPAAILFAWQIRRKFKTLSLTDIEEKVPPLLYQLTTVADNQYKENEIMSALRDDVLRLMPKIRTSYFVAFKKIWREIILIGVLSFAIIIIAALNVKLVDYNVVLNDLQQIDSDISGVGLEGGGGGGGAGGGDAEDIFGNESLASLGAEELELQINPVLSEIDLNDISDAEETEFENSEFPEDIEAATDASYNEKIAREHREIVKRYFNKISKER